VKGGHFVLGRRPYVTVVGVGRDAVRQLDAVQDRNRPMNGYDPADPPPLRLAYELP
jgi:hypothetical protein